MSAKNQNTIDINGVILLDKPLGLSSNKALQKVKKIFNAKKAGHTGSLDPLATGILPICLGQATKLSQFLLNANKRYVAVGKLGVKTTTADREGEIIAQDDYSHISVDDISQILAKFTGNIKQIPPMYSALKQNGMPLYKLARLGKEVIREPRDISIFDIKLLSYENGFFSIEVLCSKGTYIRTLVEDIGAALGSYAYVSELRRTGFAHYDINATHCLASLDKIAKENTSALDSIILPMTDMLVGYEEVLLDDKTAQAIKYGQKIISKTKLVDDSIIKLFDNNGFLALANYKDGVISPKKLFNTICNK